MAKLRRTSDITLRRMGDITSDMEILLSEMAIDHRLQMHEILALVHAYLQVHVPGCIETYDDDTNPVYYYGPKKA